MDIGKSFTYMMEDQNWIMKILIGGIVSLIPIVNFAAWGYMLTTLRNVAEGSPTPLPEWGDFGAHFMKGLYAFVGVLVYFLPVIVISCCVGILSAVAGGAAGSTSGSSSDAGGAVASIIAIVSLCLNCVVALYSLVAGVTLYAPLTRFAMSNNQLSVFWDIRGSLDLIMKNVGNYVMALLIAIVASFIASFGIILCVIGVVFTSFWSMLVAANVFGQFWRNSQGVASVPATLS
ncbi:MAG: DUF4013 domain-containing protein [Chloroflexi bacterium]|nr:DUF4013 domain-containing protein [Chloroflexota bacterium]